MFWPLLHLNGYFGCWVCKNLNCANFFFILPNREPHISKKPTFKSVSYTNTCHRKQSRKYEAFCYTFNKKCEHVRASVHVMLIGVALETLHNNFQLHQQYK